MSVDVRQRNGAAECHCHSCKRLLHIDDLSVIQFASGSKELVFQCNTCGSTTTKTLEM
jgi:hypothetical protein